jgi:hypothetical protein
MSSTEHSSKRMSTKDDPINIEEIMQHIRQQILAEKNAGAGNKEHTIPVSGECFPPEFYEHLYHAGMAYDQIGVKMHVTPVDIPLIGRLLEWLRGKLHELVLYYVNQVAAQQIKVNYHLLQALSIMSQEFEKQED